MVHLKKLRWYLVRPGAFFGFMFVGTFTTPSTITVEDVEWLAAFGAGV